jgi:hypothetical protein
MNMQGNIIHTWHLPGKGHCEYAELLESGELLVDCEAQALVKLGWRSDIIWEYRGYVHHDLAVRDDGSILVPLKEPPRRYGAFRKVIFDAVLRLSAKGKPLSRWSTHDHLSEMQRHHSPHELDNPHPRNRAAAQKKTYVYYHLNTIKLLPETPLGRSDQRFRPGNYLLCFRNTDLIVILDQDTQKIVWSWGPGILQRPHMPTMLANGNILLFDNGCCGRRYSRVIELDPVSLQIRWDYAPVPPENFFSAIRGGSQRLPNGNTLICESERGRVFEVTKTGEIVWEFWNTEQLDGRRKRIYRMTRVPRNAVDEP